MSDKIENEPAFPAKEIKLYGPISNCCGSAPRGNGDCDSMDFGLCPDCKEHCEYVYYDENGNEIDESNRD